VHDRLFRALLRLFPSEFRGDFGDGMAADFDDQHRDASGRLAAVARLWLRTVLDMLRRAPREHVDLLSRDVVYAVRMLRRHPVATLTAVASLAVGIGLNTAVYSVVSGVLWRTLPFPDSERLVVIGTVTPSAPEPGALVAASYLDIERAVRTLDPIAAGALEPVTIVAPGEPGQAGCVAVTARFFDVLGVRPALGRPFTPADYETARRNDVAPGERRTPPAVVLLGDDLWRRRFGGNRDVVGTRMRLAGGHSVEVVGVMGPEMAALDRALPGACWFPDVPDATQGMWRPRIVIGRLAETRSVTATNAELAALAQPTPDPFSNEPRTLQAAGLLDHIVGRVRTQLLFLFGAAACVLLVTCANLVNLFLAHAAGRRDEVATRVALGASRFRLVRQSLTESLVVSLLGGALGFGLAIWAVPVLVALAPANVPRLRGIGVDWSAFFFMLAVAVAIGIACGLVARLSAPRHHRKVAGAAASATPHANRVRLSIAVAEVAIALMLAVAGTLMVRTVRALDAIDLGFDPRGVVSADLSVASDDFARAQDRQKAIVERVRTLPGVRAAGVGIGPLGGGMGIGGLVVPGNPRSFDLVGVDAVSPGYFEALGVRLLAGRFFDARDEVRGPARSPVIVVNETAARAFWNAADPIGKTVIVNDKETLEVVGVIADVRGSTLERDPGPMLYQVSTRSRNFLAGSMIIRVEGDAEALVPAIRGIVRSIDREQPFAGITTLQSKLDRAMAPRVFVLRLIGLFSALGLLLAVIGVYGVLAEFVGQRIPEFGVRMAVGATAADVLRLVLGHGTRLVAVGLLLGLAGAFVVRDVMSTLVYGVETLDPIAYATAAAALVAGTIAACTLPARRAARLDPVIALRTE
jgi:putative ABC transport system permease protein